MQSGSWTPFSLLLHPGPRTARLAAAIVVLIGTMALIGRLAGIADLTSVLSGLPPMSPASAIAFIGDGLALYLLAPTEASLSHLITGRVLTSAVLIASVSILLGDLLHIPFLLGPLAHWRPSARPAPNTDVGVALISIGLIAINRPARRVLSLSEVFASVAGIVSFLSLIGYLYDAKRLYAIPSYSAISLNTALALALLAGGLLVARPDRAIAMALRHEGAGGHMMRRLLPAAIAIPVTLGWLRATHFEWLHGHAGLALLSLGNVIAFVIVIFGNGLSLNRLDEARAASEADMRRANDELESRVRERTAALTAEIEERRRAEDQTRALIEAAPDAVVVHEERGRIVLLNSSAETLFGADRRRLLGRLIGEFLPGYGAVALTGMLELQARRVDGSRLPVSVSANTLRRGNEQLVFADIRDISERKRAEAVRAAAERRFRALAETAQDAVVAMDSAGLITYFNPAAELLFRYRAEELLETPVERLLPERYRAAHRAGLKRFLATGESRLIGKHVELEGLKRDGTVFPVELSLGSWLDEGRYHFAAVLQDITHRRESETQIRRLNDTLRARALELETVNRELEAFSYSVSHDLRAPLRSIDGFSQALLEDYRDRLDDQGRDYLERVRAGAQRMGQLIDDLIQLSQVTRAELSVRPVDLTALALEIAGHVDAAYPDRHVEFTVAPDLVVRADEALLRVVLENLLDNAWKFTAGRTSARVEVGMIDSQVFILDNGVGFDPTDADKLFRPFSRLHDTKSFPGTGIGLATVERVIHRHGGTIRAKSVPERGTAFYFTLAS
ncbi:MAG: sensor histidine kinase [Acidiferrobacteraceae bacterium]